MKYTNRNINKPDLMNWFYTLSDTQLKNYNFSYGITGMGELVPTIATSDWFSKNIDIVTKKNHFSKVLKGWKFGTYSAKILDVSATFCEYYHEDIILFRLKVIDSNGNSHEMWREFMRDKKGTKFGTITRLKQNFGMTTSEYLDPTQFVGKDVKVKIKSINKKCPSLKDINIFP